MKCPSDTSMHWDIAKRRSKNTIFFKACLYTCEKYIEPVVFVVTKTL